MDFHRTIDASALHLNHVLGVLGVAIVSFILARIAQRRVKKPGYQFNMNSNFEYSLEILGGQLTIRSFILITYLSQYSKNYLTFSEFHFSLFLYYKFLVVKLNNEFVNSKIYTFSN